jgi:hypothetical protein
VLRSCTLNQDGKPYVYVAYGQLDGSVIIGDKNGATTDDQSLLLLKRGLRACDSELGSLLSRLRAGRQLGNLHMLLRIDLSCVLHQVQQDIRDVIKKCQPRCTRDNNRGSLSSCNARRTTVSVYILCKYGQGFVERHHNTFSLVSICTTIYYIMKVNECPVHEDPYS